MTVFKRRLWFSTALLTALVGTLLLKNGFVTGSLECSEYEFPCDEGECIDAGLWCDSAEDCLDGSDEKYCKKSTYFNKDPNKCSSKYFKCSDGPCIPRVGLCDNFNNCDDNSDEKNCREESSLESGSTSPPPESVTLTLEKLTTAEMPSPHTTIYQVQVKAESPDAVQHTVQIVHSDFRPSDYSNKREKARNWLFSQRTDNFGWGDETPRALSALYLSDMQRPIKRNENDMLMIKNLEMQLALHMSRNATKPMKLTDLALYINALLVSCKDPKNFYGDNMVSILREGVNAAHMDGAFVNPSIYMTLCFNNATTYDDMKRLHDIFLNWNSTTSKLHMQSLALLTTACIFKKTNYLNASMYHSIQTEFLRTVEVYGFPGNVYEAALLSQALQELKLTLAGLTDFVLKQQQADGSFGDILSTYLVLPILAGRNLVQMNDYCGQRNTPDLIPLEVLKNVKSKKMHVQYSLNYGVPPEVTQTLQLHVAKGTSFLDVMRLAQEINPKYRFKLSENREIPVIYSLGELPNDAEKGMYWTLYKAYGNSTEITSDENWVSYYGDIKKLILADEDKMLFWYRPV